MKLINQKGLKNQKKKNENSKISKIFGPFLQNPNNFSFICCFINTWLSKFQNCFSGILLKEGNFSSFSLNYFNNSVQKKSFCSLWKLTETLIENRQLFLAKEKFDDFSGFLIFGKNSPLNLFLEQMNPFPSRLLICGDGLFNEETSQTSYNLDNFLLELFLILRKLYMYSWKFMTGKHFDTLFWIFGITIQIVGIRSYI
jgi:hypothetical protein